jgi:hypothetical protein
MTEEPSRWTANFLFHNKPLTEIELRNCIPNVEFETEYWQPRPTDPIRVKLIGFTITVPSATLQKARFEAEGKANIIFNYLTGVHRYPIRGHLTNMTNDRGEGIATISVDAIVHADMIIDLANISRLMESSNERQLRQLAHYSRGVEAADIVTKFREFYQVYEDMDNVIPSTRKSPKEIEAMSLNEIEEYEILQFIRNLVNHPELSMPRAIAIATKLAAKPSLNLNNLEELELVKSYLKIMQEKAKSIVADITSNG